MSQEVGWRVRPEAPGDAPAVREVVRSAFPTDTEADLVDALRVDPAWIDGLSFVVVDDADVVTGHALLTRCSIDDVPALALAPCSVRPDAQRRGAGSAVIAGAVEAARMRGEAWIVVLGHPGYYPRFGFTSAAEAGIALSIPTSPGALMVLALRGSVPPRGTVRYPPPFGIN